MCQLITGKDGETRGALLQVAGYAAKTTLLRRPVHLIYPLVVSHIATPIAPPEDTVDRAPEYEQESGELFSPPQRPQKQSAKKAHKLLRVWTSELTRKDD